MEARLKADVLREAARYDQHILVTEEDDDMNVSWDPFQEGLVALTPRLGAAVLSQLVFSAPATKHTHISNACRLQVHSSGHDILHAVLRVQVIDVWEPVTESDVQTPLEVYKELQEDGYDVVSRAGVSGLARGVCFCVRWCIWLACRHSSDWVNTVLECIGCLTGMGVFV